MLRGLGADQSFARPFTGGRACSRSTAVPLTNHRPRRPLNRTARYDGRVRAAATTTDDVAEAAWSTKEVLASPQSCGPSKALPRLPIGGNLFPDLQASHTVWAWIGAAC